MSRRWFRREVFRLLILFAVITSIAWLWLWDPHAQRPRPIVYPFDDERPKAQPHPIDRLISSAQRTFDELIAKRTTDLQATAKAYRQRRGRHPPPGFEAWFAFAKDNDALIVEDFFDQIYHDLNPFWGIPANQTRQQARLVPEKEKITVRNGTVQNEKIEREWMEHWVGMIKGIQHHLPDVDIPINLMDEPRVMVPWEDVNRYVQVERDSRQVLPVEEVVGSVSAFEADVDLDESAKIQFGSSKWYWDAARLSCAPDTPSREVLAATNFTGPPPPPDLFPLFSFEGYVSNWTAAKDPCLQPELRESHGSFVEPISKSTTQALVPYFGGSKLPMNNDILIPAAMYWPDASLYSSGKKHGSEWEDKATAVIWRGAATGGRNREENWTRFQRHRFVSLVNGTQVRLAQQNPDAAQGPNFILQPYETYRGTAAQQVDLGTWLDQIADVGFTYLVCFPATGNASCPYTDPYFEIKNEMSLDVQYEYKYLPDLDGNSFSGRYLAFLRSTSLPLKATIYSEWHDSRLIPWLHFVPMHNSFVEVYGILEYFIGFSMGVETDGGQVVMEGGHDEEARKIAMQGKEWAEKVLRKEDMLVYVLRLLLEYRRVCDDERARLGFVGDLEGKE